MVIVSGRGQWGQACVVHGVECSYNHVNGFTYNDEDNPDQAVSAAT